jgi:hypothetical protein
MPCSIAFLAQACAVSCAAKGVCLRDPEKFTVPALAHAMVFPLISVIVTMVLLKVDWIWAIPWLMFFFALFGDPAFPNVAAPS